MRKTALTIMTAIICVIATPTFATPNTVIEQNISDAQIMGEARYQFLFMDIYDATLFAPKSGWSFEKPFALKLEYLRNLSGERIADRSAKEIRQLGFSNEVKLADWHEQMINIFPDVKKGASLTGVYKPNAETVFYSQNKAIGTIKDPEFGKWFFGIWLSEQTSDNEFRKALLGQ